jgi:hypothetical protein
MLKSQIILAVVITSGFIVITILAFSLQKDTVLGEAYRGILQALAGAWIVNFTTMVNYNFGSTKGSAEKTAMQNEITNKIIDKAQ